MLAIYGRRYDNGELVRISTDGPRIAAVEPARPSRPAADYPYVAPALFDLQINGHGGTWFSKVGLTTDDVARTLEPHFRHGITRLCPTLITNSFEALAAGFSAIRAACEQEPWVDCMVPGCHLEGPYISREDGPRGAHPLEHVRPTDWDEFRRLQEMAGNRIRLVTLAPESEGAVQFIRRATDSGVVIAIGHTAATGDQIRAAVDAGARLSTHLGNGAHGTLRRHPNYIWEQLGEPRLAASIIADGHHLPPSVVRTIIRTKGTAGTMLTCDASGLAGCPPGIYSDGLMNVEILEEGKIVLAGQRQMLAGSAQLTDVCVANAITFAGVSLREAVDMASGTPARLLGYEDIRLRRGSLADLMLFRWAGTGSRLDLIATIAAGEVRYADSRLKDFNRSKASARDEIQEISV